MLRYLCLIILILSKWILGLDEQRILKEECHTLSPANQCVSVSREGGYNMPQNVSNHPVSTWFTLRFS